MNKKIWAAPEISVVQFAADEYVSACTYTCNISDKGWFMLEAGGGRYPGNSLNEANYTEQSAAARETYAGGNYIQYFEQMTQKAMDNHDFDQLIFTDDDYINYEPCSGDHENNTINTSEAVQGWYLADQYVTANQTASSYWQKAWLWLSGGALHAAIEGLNFNRNHS